MSPALRRSIFHRLFTDGSSRGNPGPAGVGAALHTPDGHLQAKLSSALPAAATCNAAEYQACLHGLRLADALGAKNILVLSDSRLLVNQMRGAFAVRHPHLATLQKAVSHAAASFDRCLFAHVARRHNTLADSLATRASESAAATAAASAAAAAAAAAASSAAAAENVSIAGQHRAAHGIAPVPSSQPSKTSMRPHRQGRQATLQIRQPEHPKKGRTDAPRDAGDAAVQDATTANSELAPPVTVAASEPVLRESAHELARAWAPRVVRLEAA